MRKRRPIGFQQLCLLAAEQLAADPALRENQGDWKAAVKERAVALGFQSPMGDIVGRALDATERVHTTRRARPSPGVSHAPSRPDDTPPGWGARRIVGKRSALSEPDSDGPELVRPLRTEPMTPLMASMPSWLSTRLKQRA